MSINRKTLTTEDINANPKILNGLHLKQSEVVFMSQFKDLLDGGIEFRLEDTPTLTPFDIVKIEKMIQAPLPEQYRDYLLHANGRNVNKHMTECDDSYCFKVFWPTNNGVFPDEEYRLFNNFFSYDEHAEFPTETLQYNLETWKEHLPKETLPIGRGPGGNYILIGFGEENKGKIYYWCIKSVNIMEQDDDTVAKAYLGFIANSFVEFIDGFVLCDTVDY
ncbi:SMI1/KNR4 family protein [Desulfovibrio litoralis]|nr:SMI1/KNR4 family protein [Desulfovibrio litoralis]